MENQNVFERFVNHTPEKTEKAEKGIYQLFKTPAKFQPKVNTLRRTPKRKSVDNDSENKRSRTPSGQVLTGSVSAIKDQIEKKQSVSSNPSISEEDFSQTSVEHDQSENMMCASGGDTKVQSTMNDQNIANLGDKCQNNNEWEDQTTKENTDEGNIVQLLFHGKDKGEVQSAVSNRLAKQPTECEDRLTVDLQTVISMLDEIRIEFKSELQRQVEDKVKEIVTNNIDQQLNEVRKQQDETERKLAVTDAKQSMIIDTLSGISDQVKETQNKIESMEINATKRSVILSGFEASEKRGVCYRQLQAFFFDQMGIQVVIEDFYRIGSATPPDLVITLLSNTHKRLIFQNIDAIKNLVNSQNKKYYFRDLLTPRQNEKRKKGQYIADCETTKQPVDRQEISTANGQIYIGDKKYTKRVQEPDPTKLLRLTIPQLNDIMKTELQRSPPLWKDGNKFTPYAMSVDSFETINKAYMKVKLTHAEARHIVCVWRIPGVNIHESNDGCDDEDHGVSQVILDWMKKQNITHKVIFVVRNCAGKLYSDRMTTYIKAVETVMTEFPMNNIIHKNQCPTSEYTSPGKTYAAAAASPPSDRGRGQQITKGSGTVTRRGRGRGPRRGGRGGRGATGRQPKRDDKNYKEKQRSAERTQYVPPNENELRFKFSAPHEYNSQSEIMDTEVE